MEELPVEEKISPREKVPKKGVTYSFPLPSTKMLLLILPVILILFIGGFLHILGKNNMVKNQSLSVIPTITQAYPTSKPQPTGMTELNTPNWETYTSSVGAFTIQYPSTVRVSHNDITDPRTNEISKNVHFQPKYLPTDGDYSNTSSDDIRQAFYLNISFKPNLEHKSLATLKEELLTLSGSGTGREAKSVDEKIRNSIKEYSNGSISGVTYMSGWDYDDENVLFATDKYIYSVMIGGDSGGTLTPSSEKLVQKMLSTMTYPK